MTSEQSSPAGAELTRSKLMGGWVIDMGDLDAAHAVIAACRAELSAILEVRHTLWGVQVRTDSDDAAGYVASHYGEPPAARGQVSLAA